MSFSLWPHQLRAIAAIMSAVASGRPAGLVVQPTGTGKTIVLGIVSPYLTAHEAATYLRTTCQGIYSRVKRGRLKPMPGSGNLLFSREALDACLQKRRG